MTDNYKGISLISLITKFINRMILDHIRPRIDPLLKGNQSGFRHGRSTAAQFSTLRRITAGVKKRHLPAVMIFFHLLPQTITSLEGQEVKQALTEDTKEQGFKHLGNWCVKARDINVRKALGDP